MGKYWHVFGLGLQNHLAYRVNFFARALFGLVPLLAMLQLWGTIYAGRGDAATLGGLTLAQMLSYYLIAQVVDALSAVTDDDWQIAADIKDGNISQFLLKPVDYLWYRLSLFAAGRATYVMVAALPLGVFLFWFREHLVWPADGAQWLAFGLSLVLAALLQFFLSFALAALAFWVLEVSTFIFIVYAFEYLASGHLFPLDLLPAGLQRVMMLTPFPYQLYFPVSVYLGNTTGRELISGLLLQGAWVLAAWAFARFLWARGLRKYAAVGG